MPTRNDKTTMGGAEMGREGAALLPAGEVNDQVRHSHSDGPRHDVTFTAEDLKDHSLDGISVAAAAQTARNASRTGMPASRDRNPNEAALSTADPFERAAAVKMAATLPAATAAPAALTADAAAQTATQKLKL